MVESEYGTQEVKHKSTPFPASRKESRLDVGNKTVPSLCLELPLFGLLPGLGRLSRIDPGSTPTIYMESGQSHVLPTSCMPTQGAIIIAGLHRWAGKLELKYLPCLGLPQDSMVWVLLIWGQQAHPEASVAEPHEYRMEAGRRHRPTWSCGDSSRACSPWKLVRGGLKDVS